MKIPDKVYLVWQAGQDEQYFNQYFTLADAVTSESEPVEVFEAKLKSLGSFKAVPQPVKLKRVRRKKR